MTDSKHEALNADSSTLIKQAVWCGAVCALAVVLTTLNMYPPVNVQYKVLTRAVISPVRLEQLKYVLERDRKIIASGRLRYAQLLKLKLLDEAKHDGLLLVELESLWTGRATPAHIEAWLTTVTKTEPRKLAESAEARDERFARWQADAAKHYLKHHQYLSSADKTESTKTQFASTASSTPASSGVPAKFAQMTTGNEQEMKMVSGQLEFENPKVVEKQLVESVKQAEATIKKTEKQFVSALEKHAGAIEVVGEPRIRSKTSNIPTWMSASVLILAIATGSIASLLQYRIQSGGAYDPKFVGNQLAIDGLPILADIKLPALGHETTSGSTNGLFNALKNTTGRHLAVLGENLMLIWCFAITCRMLFDPLWRSVAMDSPLAAFGRLVTGMP
ncbi:MAG: hypothetical protein SFV81_22365 [Pirellulaceae bacterium]|nr:hypothetical protein [Pirellulaceae bacterium]